MPRPTVRTERTVPAEAAALLAYQSVLEYDERRRELVTERARAIQAALDEGSTLSRLAHLFGVAEGRIRQM